MAKKASLAFERFMLYVKRSIVIWFLCFITAIAKRGREYVVHPHKGGKLTPHLPWNKATCLVFCVILTALFRFMNKH